MAYKINGNNVQIDSTNFYIDVSSLDTTTLPSNQVDITGSDGAAGDQFSAGIAIGNGKIYVGRDEFGTANGATRAASFHIFNLDGTEEARIVPNYPLSNNYYGRNFTNNNSIAAGCGKVVVGAYGLDEWTLGGSAFIFDADGSNQIHIQNPNYAIGTVNDTFGAAVAIGHGLIAIGDRAHLGGGTIYIYSLDGNFIREMDYGFLNGGLSDDYGRSLAIGNNRIIVGAWADDDDGNASGSAYILDFEGNLVNKITASDAAAGDNFGYKVAAGCGKFLVGAPAARKVYVFDADGNEEFIIDESASSDIFFGKGLAIGDGRIVVGMEQADSPGFNNDGGMKVYDLSGTELFVYRPEVADVYSGNCVAIGHGKIALDIAGGSFASSSIQGSVSLWDTPKQTHILDFIKHQIR